MKKLTTRQIVEKNLSRSSPLRDHFILWLHDIRSLHNVGAAFRNADTFGIRQLLLSGFTPTPPRPEITKTAIGAEEHVNWRAVKDEKNEILKLRKEGYFLIGLEQTDSSIHIDDFTLPGEKICLILGNEVTGVESELIQELDDAVEIPQFGMKHSLNVSVAAGIALYAFYQKFRTARFE